jgi:hypothetical protein
MKLTALGDVEGSDTDDMSVLRGINRPPEEVILPDIPVSSDPYSSRYLKLIPGEEIQQVALTNIAYWFNNISGFKDPMQNLPITGFIDSTIDIPVDADGVVYLIVNLMVLDVTIAYAEALPEAVVGVYYRALAYVTRGGPETAPVLRLRCFGLFTVPAMMPAGRF